MADDLDRYMESAAAALRLPLEEAWTPTVKASLKVSLAHAKTVEDFQLPDEAEPGPIFRA